MSTGPQGTPAGWYPSGNVQRYWDGGQWTEQTAPLQGASAQTGPSQPAPSHSAPSHSAPSHSAPAGNAPRDNGSAPVYPGHSAPPRTKKPFYLRWWFLALAAVVVIAVLSNLLSGGDDTVTTGATDGASSTAPAGTSAPAKKKATSAPAKKAPGIGTPVRDGKFQFTVTKVTKGKNRVGSADFGKSAQGQFIYVYVTVKNTGNEAQTLFGDNQTLIDAEGRKFTPDTEAAIYLDESQTFIEDINPGNQLKGVILFDVPKDAAPTSIELHDSAFSGGVEVSLK
ncbi:DUF4352 domain-containing protein [Kineosporia sp. A_224]|uniref:DUF4352 domain-containing protein n=1 Tax=Kineosporia sp. A_224 TaxID=1962180 RepID=UPI00130450FB|nr:DUF4352 domain-containing protein [Kineosporia sp. A_224]